MRLRFLDKPLYLWVRARSRRHPVKPLSEFDPTAVRRMLVVSSTALGDTLLSTPALRALRNRFPQAHITAHFHRRYIPLFRNNPHIDSIIPYDGGYRRFFKTVAAFRGGRFDLAVILHGNGPQAIPMAYLSGAPFVVRIPNKTEYRFLLSNSALTPENDVWSSRHCIEDRLAIAGLLGADVSNTRFELPIEAHQRQAAKAALRALGLDEQTQTLIGFQAGASKSHRMWPVEHFIELGRRLLNDHDRVRIVLTGAPAEQRLCNEIAQAIGPRAVSAAGAVPIDALGALLRELAVLVTPDTGTMHVAVAAGCPTVCLYATADPVKTAPFQDRERHRVIRAPAREGERRMQDIEPAVVYEEIRTLLQALAR